MRYVLSVLVALMLPISIVMAGTVSGLPQASVPLGTTPDAVLIDQGSGCPTNSTSNCATSQVPSVRVGQPVQTNCATIAAPFQYQPCIDTSVNPPVSKIYIGTTWWSVASLSPSGGVVPLTAGLLQNNAALGAASTLDYPIGVQRNSFATNGDSPPLFFVPSGSACTLNGGDGDGGSQVPSINGRCWLAVFPQGGRLVDVTQFGADRTGVADSGAAVRAALKLGSHHTFVFGGGTFVFSSVGSNPYPADAGSGVIQLLCTQGSPCVDVRIDGQGATITTSGAAINANWLQFDWLQHFDIGGFTLQAPSGFSTLPVNSEPSGISPFHLVDGIFHDFQYTGAWYCPASGCRPALVAGNGLQDVTFARFNAQTIGLGFDVAFLRRVTFDDNHLVGMAGDGVNPSPYVGWNVLYDTPWVTASYGTPWGTYTTDHVTVTDSNTFSNFGIGMKLNAGSDYKISAKAYSNAGYAASFGYGAGLYVIEDEAGFETADAPTNIQIVGANLSSNGSITTGGGIVLNGTATANGRFISNVTISGNVLQNNTDSGVKTIGTNVTNLSIGTNETGGAAQTTRYDTNTLSLLGPGTTSARLGGACSGTFNPATNLTWYCGDAGVVTAQLTSALVVRVNGQVSNLEGFNVVAPGAGHSVTYTLQKNAADIAITCTMTNTTQSCTDATHSITVTPGDVLEMKIVADGAAAASSTVHWATVLRAP